MSRPFRRAAALLLVSSALACSGSRTGTPVPLATPQVVAPAAVLAPSNGCPDKLRFAWSPEGELTLICGDTLHRLDRHLREKSAFILEKGEPVIDMAFSARSGTLWIAREDRTVAALSSKTGRGLEHWNEPEMDSTIERCLFPSPDGRRVAVLGWSGISILERGKDTRTFMETNIAESVAWSPDAKRIAFWAGGFPYEERFVAVHSVGAEGPERTFDAHRGRGSSVRFSDDGRVLMSTAVDDVAFIAWDLASGERIRSVGLPFEAPVGHLVFPGYMRYPQGTRWNPKDAAVLVPGAGGVVRRPSAGFGIERRDFATPNEPRWSDPFADVRGEIEVAPRGNFVAAPCGSLPICVWDLDSGEYRQAGSPAVRHTDDVVQLLHAERRDLFVTRTYGGEVQVWDLARGTLKRKSGLIQFRHGGVKFGNSWRSSRSTLFLSPDGREIVVKHGRGGPADVFDTTSGSALPVSSGIDDLGVDNTRFYTVRSGNLSAWDLGAPVHREASVDLRVDAPIALSSDGTRLAVAGQGGGIQVRSVDPPFAILAHRKGPSLSREPLGPDKEHIVFSPDCHTLAVTQKGVLFLWKTESDAWLGPLESGTPGRSISMNNRVTFSPDGRTVSAADTANVLWTWDVATLARIGSVSLRDAAPASNSASSSGTAGRTKKPKSDSNRSTPAILFTWAPRWFASTADDGSIELRAAPGGPLLATLRAIAGLDAGYVFTPDGHFDLVGDNPDLARPYVGCSRNGVPAPLAACEALHTPGLLPRLLASLPPAPAR